ncbi:Double C2-like domain-containing protein beta [Armadillidium nasatum]|uniref:Double C2-like domain-containing protein beta n=1 Tax=Armadillidium nasatum TaxID=96803 RepID=A0A5N5T1C1_9CRUS|nr:Double C2-like domain-containing protein beta [Armadillidium nasatum]
MSCTMVCDCILKQVRKNIFLISKNLNYLYRKGYKGYLGVLDFSLLYDSHSQSLHCTLHSAKDLKPLDSTPVVDAYVKLNLLPGASKSNKLKTQVVPKSVHPDFNETLTYYGISDHDMARKTLRLMVLVVNDAERFKHDFLGEIRIPLKSLIPHEARRFRKHLEQKTNLAEDESKEFELGKILLSLKYSSQRGALVVGVVRCAHLPSMDANGFSDPYVKVQLKQAKIVQKKFKTTVKWRNLNPEFNEEFAFEMKRNELPKKTLEVRVFDKDVGRMDDFIAYDNHEQFLVFSSAKRTKIMNSFRHLAFESQWIKIPIPIDHSLLW